MDIGCCKEEKPLTSLKEMRARICEIKCELEGLPAGSNVAALVREQGELEKNVRAAEDEHAAQIEDDGNHCYDG